jgi:hypothetical protein
VSKRLIAAGIASWLGATILVFFVVTTRESAPGSAGDAPRRWPAPTAIAPAPGRATLVMFAHPMCPCTRASLHELERVIAKSGGVADVWVVFARATEGEMTLAPRAIASAIPGVRVIDDPRGELARAFGAQTSGHVVAYDAAGALLYSGGLTSARAHEGDSVGASALVRALARPSAPQKHPVFGCGLFDPET